MRELTYWQKRFLQISVRSDRMTTEYLTGMAGRYKELGKSIEREIDTFVSRYSDESGLSEQKINEMLSRSERATWSMTLKEFRRKAIAGGYENELNIEYYKSRINRLQKLQTQMNMEFAEFARKEEKRLEAFLGDLFQETYLRNIYELTDRGAFAIPFDTYNRRALKLALSTPWMGSNFSVRIWKNHLRILPERLSRVLSQATMQGWGIDKTVNEMMKGFNGFARNRMVTLVQSEAAHITETATLESYRETGVKKYEWLSTLEKHTCDQPIRVNGITYLGCRQLDGETFDVDFENPFLPPAHPNCRCTTVPVIEGYKPSERWMRDPETREGKIINYIQFDEWKEKYLSA